MSQELLNEVRGELWSAISHIDHLERDLENAHRYIQELEQRRTYVPRPERTRADINSTWRQMAEVAENTVDDGMRYLLNAVGDRFVADEIRIKVRRKTVWDGMFNPWTEKGYGAKP